MEKTSRQTMLLGCGGGDGGEGEGEGEGEGKGGEVGGGERCGVKGGGGSEGDKCVSPIQKYTHWSLRVNASGCTCISGVISASLRCSRDAVACVGIGCMESCVKQPN